MDNAYFDAKANMRYKTLADFFNLIRKNYRIGKKKELYTRELVGGKDGRWLSGYVPIYDGSLNQYGVWSFHLGKTNQSGYTNHMPDANTIIELNISRDISFVDEDNYPMLCLCKKDEDSDWEFIGVFTVDKISTRTGRKVHIKVADIADFTHSIPIIPALGDGNERQNNADMSENKQKRCHHEKYGIGVILSENGDSYTIDFSNFGVKTILKKYVEMK